MYELWHFDFGTGFETFFTEADQAVSEIYHRIFEEKRDKFI